MLMPRGMHVGVLVENHIYCADLWMKRSLVWAEIIVIDLTHPLILGPRCEAGPKYALDKDSIIR